MPFRRIKQTIAMYQTQGQLTFQMGQALLQAAMEDLEDLSESGKKLLKNVNDGVTIELKIGDTVLPFKVRVVPDDKPQEAAQK